MLVLGLLMLPRFALASTVFTMSPYHLGNLYETYENPASAGTFLTGVEYYAGIGAKYSGKIRQGEGSLGSPVWGSVQIGSNFWGYAYDDVGFLGPGDGPRPTVGELGMGDLSLYEAYALQFTNNNENAWMYNLYFNIGYTDSSWGETDYYVQNTWTSINAGDTAVLTLDFANAQVWGGIYSGDWVDLSTISGLDLTHVSNIGFNIGANVPLPGTLPDHVYEVSVLPIPEPTSMLLLGMGVLGLFGLKRRKA